MSTAEKTVKRMRVFAGPNGSGKSTIIKEIQKVVWPGVYINADDIEKAGRERKFINLGDYNLESDTDTFKSYLESSTLVIKAREEGLKVDLSLSNNIIRLGQDTNSYEAALVSDYIRRLLILKGETFSFETVMSHPSKLDIFKAAAAAGFRSYLYFISTESADINVNRVEVRVRKGGHPVDEQKIRERYIRSMDLVTSIIPYCHRCFIFDNSLDDYRLILEVEQDRDIRIQPGVVPEWVDKYVLQKLGV